jgi:hypothetical protein
VLDGDGRLVRALGVHDHVQAAGAVTDVEAGGPGLGHGPLGQDQVGQPAGAPRRIDEGGQHVLGAGGDGLRGGGDEPAVDPFTDRPIAAGPLEAGDHGLDVPRQRVDAEQLGHPAGERGVVDRCRVPRVEQVEPLLPAPAGALADPLVGADEVERLLAGGWCAGAGEQLGPRRGVALAGLGHAGPDEALERPLDGHRVPLDGRETSPPTLATSLAGKDTTSDRRPESWAPFAPAGPAA